MIVISKAKTPHARGFTAVLQFLGLTAGLAVLFSLLVLPWVDLSWWQVVRRCVSVASATSLWICIRYIEHRSFADYGLNWSKQGRRQLLFGITLGIAALVAVFGGWLGSGEGELVISGNHLKLWRTLLGFVPAAALIGTLEELVFRGYLLQHFRRYSTFGAVVLSSALYSIVHVKNLDPRHIHSLELVGLFILGCTLCAAYLWSERLWLSISLHAVLAYGARVNKLLFSVNPHYAWLIGTSRIINGMTSWGLLLLITGAIWLFMRRPGLRDGEKSPLRQSSSGMVIRRLVIDSQGGEI